MSRARLLTVAMAVLATLGRPVAAQPPQVPPPSEPLLRHAPAMAAWKIIYQYRDEQNRPTDGSAPPLPPNRITSVTVTKTGRTYWEQTTLSSGKTYEKWIFDGVQLQSAPDNESISPVAAPTPDNPEPYYSDYSQTDFPELRWISLENYRSAELYEGKSVYYFEESGGARKAALTVEDQFPVQFSDPEAIRSYLFLPAPTAPLRPPARFMKVLETHKKGLEALKYRPSLP